MIRKIFYNYFFVLSLLFIFCEKVYSYPKFCSIIYGEHSHEKELEKKYFKTEVSEILKEEYGFECYQIGVEYNHLKEPILDKPIFSCCQNYVIEDKQG